MTRDAFSEVTRQILNGGRSDPIGSLATKIRCRLCDFALGSSLDDDEARAICGECSARPEAKRLGTLKGAAVFGAARAFTDAEKSLISKVHSYMPSQQLLAILNERMACDLGPDARPYTMAQLQVEIAGLCAPVSAGANDWASLRKLIVRAKREGILDLITEQVINDFAVVFSLNARQLLSMKEIVLQSAQPSAAAPAKEVL